MKPARWKTTSRGRVTLPMHEEYSEANFATAIDVSESARTSSAA